MTTAQPAPETPETIARRNAITEAYKARFNAVWREYHPETPEPYIVRALSPEPGPPSEHIEPEWYRVGGVF